MGDRTLDDIREAVEGGQDSGGSDGGGDTGKWMLELYERLDQDGRLDAILFGPDGGPQQGSPGSAPGEGPAAPESTAGEIPAADGGAQLDADTLKGVMLKVYDNSGMIPGVSEDPTLSEMIKLVDSKPELVDRLIQQHL